MTMTLIETKTLGTAAASIEFTSIPGDATDLVVVCSLRSARAAVDDPISIDVNGGSTAVTIRRLRGNGSATASGTDGPDLWYTSAASTTSNTFDNASIYFPNYAGSTNKSFSSDGVSENNATEAYQAITAGLWASTAAITSVKVKSRTGSNLVIGSTISLYKITKGTDGIVVVS